MTDVKGFPQPAQPASDLALTIDVEPRKPRLAWQGMERKQLAAPVPTQVVEIVRPGRAVERQVRSISQHAVRELLITNYEVGL